MAIERALTASIKTWRSKYFDSKKAFLVSAIICAWILFILTPLIAIINSPDENDPNLNYTCYDAWQIGYVGVVCISSFFPLILLLIILKLIFYSSFFFLKQHSIVYSLLPYSIMIISNLFLVNKLFVGKNDHTGRSSNEMATRRKSMSVSVLALCTLFILFTSPASIASAFYLEELLTTSKGLLLFHFFDCFAFTFHSCNFIILISTNNKFRLHFNRLLKICKIQISYDQSLNVSTFNNRVNTL